MNHILSADIGGTNSRFAYFVADNSGKLSLKKTLWIKTGDAESFEGLLSLVKKEGFSPAPGEADISVFAVAGPVIDGCYSSPPFIAWDIDISIVKSGSGRTHALLINDFVAQAFACRSPVRESARRILSGEESGESAVAVIGAGTALGKAALMPDGLGGYIAIPSEGGHANFPFVSDEEREFQEFLKKELGEDYITANYVVSGRGIAYTHLFLTGERLSPEEVTGKFSADSITLDWASKFYGRVCRNFALEVASLGGLYIAGGVAAKSPSLLTHENFKNEFRSSRTMSSLLQKIPIWLITDEESGLWGAALLGLQKLRMA